MVGLDQTLTQQTCYPHDKSPPLPQYALERGGGELTGSYEAKTRRGEERRRGGEDHAIMQIIQKAILLPEQLPPSDVQSVMWRGRAECIEWCEMVDFVFTSSA